MASKYAIDTSAWIEYFSNKETSIKEIIEKEKLITSIIAIAELADKFANEDLSFESVLSFVQKRANIISLDISLSIKAAEIKKHHRKIKSKFGLADAIHIATAKSQKAIFITKDSDFKGFNNIHLI